MTEHHDEDSIDQTSQRGPGLRTAMAAVLALLLVVGAAGFVWGLTRLHSADTELEARADVARVAEQFTVAVNNYDSSDMDAYESTVGKLLSTKFRATYEKSMEDIVAQVQQAKMNSEGKILASGVASIDSDSAKVLVVSDATVKTVYDQRDRHFRWEVSLVKVDGKWLVDDFTPVA